MERLETHPVSEPSGTPVTNVGLQSLSRECMSRTRANAYVHHCHRVVVLSEAEREVLEELGGDAHEILLRQAKLVLDLVEDAPSSIG